ncbi:MAG: ABC transporter substrate-binding protein [Litorimonas sp.]
MKLMILFRRDTGEICFIGSTETTYWKRTMSHYNLNNASTRRGFNLMAIRSVISATFLVASVTAMATPAFAADKTQAEKFTQALIVELSDVAKRSDLSDTSRDLAYRDVLQAKLATESIGKFLFKGAPSELATDAQRAEYEALFPSYIAATFAAQIGELAERQINVKASRLRGDTEALVRSELVDKNGIKKASIDWRLRWIDDEPFLLDVLVERISPLVSKRKEFSSLASRDGVDALLAHMKTASK